MKNFKSHELTVIEILASSLISPSELDEINNNGILTGYETTGVGYFLTIKHSLLPIERIVFDKPMLIGNADGIESGFVLFIQNNELTLECHGWGNDIPDNYRELNISISIKQ